MTGNAQQKKILDKAIRIKCDFSILPLSALKYSEIIAQSSIIKNNAQEINLTSNTEPRNKLDNHRLKVAA